LLALISTTQREKWLSTGFNCGSLIEAYKQVYGLTSQQFETLLTLLSNIALK
jgi:capsule polysaccharide export protein KpsC/LpsZ